MTEELKTSEIQHVEDDSQRNQILAQNKEIDKPKEEKEELEDPNWKAFREGRKKDRAEKEAAIKRAEEKEREIAALKAAMEAAFSKQGPSATAYQQYYGQEKEETEDQRLEKKIAAALMMREENMRREHIEREQREYPQRLMQTHPDFSAVCSQENLDYLDYHYPEISRPLQRLPDGYDKWSDIYHALKKLLPNGSQAKKDAKRAEANSLKPQSMTHSTMASQETSSLSSWKDAERRRAENWERMQRVMKGL